MNRLSLTEYQFMNVIWNYPDGISSAEIYELFPQALSTKSTILSRIVKKGYLLCERKGKQVYYYAKLSKRDYEKLILQEDIKNSMGYPSFQKLFAAFCGKKNLTGEQLKQLEELVKQLEKDD